MELFLGHNNNNNNVSDNTAGTSNMIITIEKEHMFDKVVTPSDVGKLNRLVIPKQHAEKYFPLDSSSNEKGLLLNFEDRNGKPWRFRYSYWNSSQSYVMTKGWSRFVKEKKLDAGDIVSFQRGVGDQGRHRLFIDGRRRPCVNVTHPNVQYSDIAPASAHLDFHNQFNFSWGNRLLCSLPQLQNYLPPPPPPPQPHFQFSDVQAYGNYQFYVRENAGPYNYVRPSIGGGGGGGGGVGNHHQVGDDVAMPMVIDSVPVVEGRTVGKRLRLFGVNMDCPVPPSSGNSSSSSCGEELEELHLVGRPTTHGLISVNHLAATSNSSPLNVGDGSTLQLRLPNSSSSSTSGGCWGGGSGLLPMAATQSHELSKKGKSTHSLSFDLDL